MQLLSGQQKSIILFNEKILLIAEDQPLYKNTSNFSYYTRTSRPRVLEIFRRILKSKENKKYR